MAVTAVSTNSSVMNREASQAEGPKRQRCIEQYFSGRTIGLMQRFRFLADIEPHILHHIIAITPRSARSALRQTSRFMRKHVNLATQKLKLDQEYVKHGRDLAESYPFVRVLVLALESDAAALLTAVQERSPHLLQKLHHLDLRCAYGQVESKPHILPEIVAACPALSALHLTLRAHPRDSTNGPFVTLCWNSSATIKASFTSLLTKPLLLTALLQDRTSSARLSSLAVQGQLLATRDYYSDQHFIDLPAALPTFSALTALLSLTLHGQDLTATPVTPPFTLNLLPQLTRLSLQSCWPTHQLGGANTLLSHIAELSRLRHLSLGAAPDGDIGTYFQVPLPEDTTLPPAFSTLTALTHLLLNASRLTPPSFTLLHPLTALHLLSLSGVAEPVSLTPFPHLTHLRLKPTPFSRPHAAVIPTNSPNLRFLDLEHFTPQPFHLRPPPGAPPYTPPLTTLKMEAPKSHRSPPHTLPCRFITPHIALQTISINGFSLPSKFFRALATMPSLSRLDLLAIRLKDPLPSLPVASLPHLTYLTLNVASCASSPHRDADTDRDPTDALLARLHMPSLAKLAVLSCCSLLSFFALLRLCPPLRASLKTGHTWAAHLWFDNAQLLAVASLDAPLLAQVITIDTRTCTPNLTDSGVAAAAAAAAGAGAAFTCLRLHACSTKAPLSDAALQALAQHCPGLQRLHVCSALGFTARALRLVAGGMPDLVQLRLLDLAGLGDRELVELSRRCLKLKELTLGSMEGVGEQGYLALGGLVRLEHLEAITALGLRVAHVKLLLPMLPSLQALCISDVGGVQELEDADWESIPEEVGCPSVEIIFEN